MNENESRFIYLQKSKDYFTVIWNTGDSTQRAGWWEGLWGGATRARSHDFRADGGLHKPPQQRRPDVHLSGLQPPTLRVERPEEPWKGILDPPRWSRSSWKHRSLLAQLKDTSPSLWKERFFTNLTPAELRGWLMVKVWRLRPG